MIASLGVIEPQTHLNGEGSFSRDLEQLMNQYNTVRSVYSPSDFLAWREHKTLVITPKFQRRGVWQTPARSFFIDTLLRGMPVPPIYLRKAQNEDQTQEVREVVDGQQRLRAVLDFIDGKFRLAKTLSGPWRGQQFDQLPKEDQRRITSFNFSAEVFAGISDEEVLEVFSRLNTYSVPLNAQELRNGRFFGHFKQSAYKLAQSYLGFWRRHHVFTEQNIARMLEVELTSELLIAGIAGMQDKKKTIDNFYKDFDESYPNKSRDRQRFRDTLAEISEAFDGSELADSDFRRPPFFYTLYCVVYHHLFGLPEQSRKTPKKKLTAEKRMAFREAVASLSAVLAQARDDEEGVARKFIPFVTASSGQTDNIKPRQTRFDFLYNEAFA